MINNTLSFRLNVQSFNIMQLYKYNLKKNRMIIGKTTFEKKNLLMPIPFYNICPNDADH